MSTKVVTSLELTGGLSVDGIGGARIAYVTADVDKTNDTVLSNITGLAFTVLSGSVYAMDGMISYYGLSGVDLKFAFTSPTVTWCSWSLFGGILANTAASGSMEYTSIEGIGDANTQLANTDTGAATALRPAGIFLFSAGGTLQARTAQNTTNGTAMAIKRGSWLRLTRLT